MAQSDLARLAMGMYENAPTVGSKTNMALGGLTSGIAKFMNLKQVWRDALRQMEMEEEFKKRSEEREFGRQKELQRMRGRAGMEERLGSIYGIRPIDRVSGTGVLYQPPEGYTPSPGTAMPGAELETMPGYGLDTYSLAAGQQPKQTQVEIYRDALTNAVENIRSGADIKAVIYELQTNFPTQFTESHRATLEDITKRSRTERQSFRKRAIQALKSANYPVTEANIQAAIEQLRGE